MRSLFAPSMAAAVLAAVTTSDAYAFGRVRAACCPSYQTACYSSYTPCTYSAYYPICDPVLSYPYFPATSVVVHVPDKAKVYLGDALMTGIGPARCFYLSAPYGVTTCVTVRVELKPGDEDDGDDPVPPAGGKTVAAPVEKDERQPISVSKTICVTAGATAVIDFRPDFQPGKK